jgi:histone H3/H4
MSLQNELDDAKSLNEYILERARHYGAESIHPSAMSNIHTYLEEAVGSVLCFVASDAEQRKTETVDTMDLKTAKKTANVLLQKEIQE